MVSVSCIRIIDSVTGKPWPCITLYLYSLTFVRYFYRVLIRHLFQDTLIKAIISQHPAAGESAKGTFDPEAAQK